MSNLLWWDFRIEYMLLKESVLPVQMRTVKESISINDLFKVILHKVVLKFICLTFDVILVTSDMSLLYNSCGW